MSEFPEERKIALDHGWRWFEYHAQQRLTMFRFYLILIGASATAYFTAIPKVPGAAVAAAAIGWAASFFFCKLDRRVSNLIKAGERAMSEQESYLATACQFEKIRIVDRADLKEKGPFNSYTKVFVALFWVAGVVFAFATLLAAYQVFIDSCTATKERPQSQQDSNCRQDNVSMASVVATPMETAKYVL